MDSVLNSGRSHLKLAQLIAVFFWLCAVGIVIVYWICLSSVSTGQGGANIESASSAPVFIKWSTRREEKTAGYVIYRATSSDGLFSQLNHELIPATNDLYLGGTYVYTDTDTIAGVTYYYQLEDVGLDGKRTRQDPIAVTARGSSVTIFGWAIPESTYPLAVFASAGILFLIGTTLWIFLQK